MNWKEFMKPDRKKVVVFILSFVVLLFLPICHYVGSCALPPATCPGLLSLLDVVKMNDPFYVGIINSCSLYLIFGIMIIFYFISCLIIWIYNKTKKK